MSDTFFRRGVRQGEGIGAESKCHHAGQAKNIRQVRGAGIKPDADTEPAGSNPDYCLGAAGGVSEGQPDAGCMGGGQVEVGCGACICWVGGTVWAD